jgi:cysteine synthase
LLTLKIVIYIYNRKALINSVKGGTISSVGRYVKKYEIATEIVLVDTEFSAYYDLLISGRFENGQEDPQPLWVSSLQ